MKIIYIILLSAIAIACKDKKELPGCGCEGPTIQVLKDLPASYLGDKAFLLRQTNEGGHKYETSVLSCTAMDTLTKTPDITKPDYILSGELKQQCNPQPLYSSMYIPNSIRITKIEKAP
ncbi:hypothetical protein [Dyadobacter sp. MSC1_007]|jgi:hypothetical protein|uniref:hypothetical protein n=1 Tax=Dyadobacter sp. MSC1_007 TaxID=2909264 RepID=UPI00202E02E2|nr:hypothetical protein [Dyadobacter sp. MSC1_007]